MCSCGNRRRKQDGPVCRWPWTDGKTLGGSSPSISANGRWVVYNVASPLISKGTDEDLAGMFVHDTRTGHSERLGHIEGDDPTISADGRYVAFSSEIRDLVPGDTNRKADLLRVSTGAPARSAESAWGGSKPLGNGWFPRQQAGQPGEHRRGDQCRRSLRGVRVHRAQTWYPRTPTPTTTCSSGICAPEQLGW